MKIYRPFDGFEEIEANPEAFIRSLPVSYRKAQASHRKRLKEIIQNCAIVLEYAENHRHVMKTIRNSEYWKNQRQKPDKGQALWVTHYVLDATTPGRRKLSSKYARILDHLRGIGVRANCVFSTIDEMGGIEKAARAAAGCGEYDEMNDERLEAHVDNTIRTEDRSLPWDKSARKTAVSEYKPQSMRTPLKLESETVPKRLLDGNQLILRVKYYILANVLNLKVGKEAVLRVRRAGEHHTWDNFDVIKVIIRP